MSTPRALILSGYGVNCEAETAFAFQISGAESEIVHVNDLISGEKKLQDYEILAFPGGFSYGDDTGAGKALANRITNNLREELLTFLARDTLTIAICNGFQVAAALGLLPALKGKYGERQAALMANDSARYICRWVHLKCPPSKCIFTQGIDRLYLPIAHGEGKFYMAETELQELEAEQQVACVYTKEDGNPANGLAPDNPNGALHDIAGICDPSGRIFGLMPHPERGIYTMLRPDYPLLKEIARRKGEVLPEKTENIRIFENAVRYFEN